MTISYIYHRVSWIILCKFRICESSSENCFGRNDHIHRHIVAQNTDIVFNDLKIVSEGHKREPDILMLV